MTTAAAILQILIGLAFLTIPLVRHRYGPAAQAAAEAELERQGVPATVLTENKIRFDAGGHETAVPASVAAVMGALAVLNLTGSHLGLVLSWVFQSLVLVGGLLILHSQLTAATSVEKAFARKGDPVLQRIDVPALLDAAGKGFPDWVFSVLQNVRHAIGLGGSVLVLVLTIAAA